jgi:preprotein translocase subunit SecE
MEPQKSQGTARPSPLSIKKAFRRFEDLKSEFVRIQWTEEGQVLGYAKVVVLATFICGMLLYITDLIVQRTLIGFDGILRMIFG